MSFWFCSCSYLWYSQNAQVFQVFLSFQLRSIVSSVGTFNHNLTRFFYDLLSPLVPDDYSWKCTFSFVSQIMNANHSSKFLVSYNITSLFTNIPLQETIDLAIILIINRNLNLNVTIKNFAFNFTFCYITDSFYFYPNMKFTTEKQVHYSMAFLDVLFQVSKIKISHFKRITNLFIQDFS